MKLINCLKDNRGSIYTDTVINFLLTAIIIVVGITTFGAIAKKYTLMQSASTVKRMIETDGKYDAAEQALIVKTLADMNVNATVTVTPAKNKYSLGEKFKVTLTASADIGGGMGKLSLPLDGSATGSCERYSK